MTEKHPNLNPPWKKGDPSPNPTGRPKGSGITDKLRKIIEDNEGKGAKAIADAIYAAALTGDPRIINIVLDRLEGKVTDKLDLNGEIKVIEQRFVVAEKPKPSDGS